jgi:predicted transcriptional regulator
MKEASPQMPAKVTTVRLEPALSERLRAVSYYQRIKKQPLIRSAVEEFLSAWESGAPARREKISRSLRAPAELAGAKPESVRLDYETHERLRRFQYDADVPRQTALRASLIQYLDRYDAKVGDVIIEAKFGKTRPRLLNRKPRKKSEIR